ncbi:hypothetical protein DL769_010974 [Monosporascus sp. CRB-8-3]|nr:hypothetical protein DL769_010974 [Monosporascus sp. CRB-8-3]
MQLSKEHIATLAPAAPAIALPNYDPEARLADVKTRRSFLRGSTYAQGKKHRLDNQYLPASSNELLVCRGKDPFPVRLWSGALSAH